MAKKKIRNDGPHLPLEVTQDHNLTTTATRLLNGALQEAVLGFNPGGPGNQLSQVDTIFLNMRYYLISNMRQPLSEAYAELGLVKTVCDVPVEDAFRGGFQFHSKELSPEEVEELQYTIETEDDLAKMKYREIWNRLFGGAGLVIVTDQDPEEPLVVERMKEGDKLAFKDADMWELFWDKQNVEGDGEPMDSPGSEYYHYYGHKIHKSRVLITKGIRAPSFIRPRLRGWGLSQVEILVRSINQYLKANDLTFEVLDEFKVDIYKIKNLTETLQTAEGVAAVQHRIKVANMEKNFMNAITMDADDDFLQKELSFQGLSDVMVGIRMQVASDLRMPLTKVFGISAQGFSSGEDDIENYNAMVESSVRQPCKRDLITLGKLRCQQLFGYAPDDLTGIFQPLRILSSEQQENVKGAVHGRIVATFTAGLMSQKEAKDAINKEKLIPIQLDTTADTVSEQMDREKEIAEASGAANGGGGKPGKGASGKEKAGPASTKVTKPAKNSMSMELQNDLEEFNSLTAARRNAYSKISNPGKVDEELWSKAKRASQHAFGRERWAFVTWFYKKHGGHFSKAAS